jgi:hypothetical protein
MLIQILKLPSHIRHKREHGDHEYEDVSSSQNYHETFWYNPTKIVVHALSAS